MVGRGADPHYGRDKKSGTSEAFRAFTGIAPALRAAGRPANADLPYSGIADGQPGHLGFEDTNAVVDRIRGDRNGIGYVGRAANPYPGVKTLRIRPAANASAFVPNAQTIRTMDYPMARELFLYRATKAAEIATRFIDFCLSDAGQAAADSAGFVGFGAANLLERPRFGDRAPQRLKDAVAAADRVVFSFRFNFGQTSLDTVSEQNFRRLIKFLQRAEIAGRKLLVVGHADSVGMAGANTEVSKQRAENFARKLEDNGVTSPTAPLWFGAEYPVADDAHDANSPGARRNRRVDLYLAK